MRPGHLGRYRAFAFAVAPFGGALVLLASRWPGDGATPFRVMPPPLPDCATFIATDMDRDPAHAGKAADKSSLSIVLHRNRNYESINLDDGAFVGEMENTHPKKANPAYPALKPGDKACIWFKRSSSGAYEASFHLANGGQPIQLSALYCKHGSGRNPGKKPIWVAIPENGRCEEYRMTLGAVTVTVQPPAREPFTGESLFPRLKSELVKAGLTSAAADTAVDRAKAAGPWYPCEPFGCCRAFF